MSNFSLKSQFRVSGYIEPGVDRKSKPFNQILSTLKLKEEHNTLRNFYNFYPGDVTKFAVVSATISLLKFDKRTPFSDVQECLKDNGYQPSTVLHALGAFLDNPERMTDVQNGSPLVTTVKRGDYVGTFIRANERKQEIPISIRDGFVKGSGFPKDALYLGVQNDHSDIYEMGKSDQFPYMDSLIGNFRIMYNGFDFKKTEEALS